MTEVLQVVPTLETGGAEKMAVHLAGELMRMRAGAGVISFFEPRGSQLQRMLQADGVPIWPLGKQLGLDPAMIGKLRSLIRKLQPMVLHTHLASLRYVVPAVAGLPNPPRIVHTVHRVAERDTEAWFRWPQRLCMGRCGEVVAVSEEVARSCARIYRRVKVSVIPNGIPLTNSDSALAARTEIRRTLGIADDCFVFCSVARLRAVKNHTALIRAFAGIAKQTGAHLLIAGGGELRNELERLAQTLEIAMHVHFLGERDDVAQILAASDAFVLSSLSEGIPLSVLEAMAARLPVLVTSVGGLPEVVRDGVEGLLVPPGDVEALATAMRQLIRDCAARAAMSRAAADRISQQFDARVMVGSYLSIYKRLGARIATEGV
ncbi:MAG TPA: glycosyltransferase [Bryobacteraceae bacterium]|nr:glycosyltransferase [Bryobacteraceae bacterium]